MGLAALARLAMPGTDLEPLGRTLIERAHNEPQNADLLMDLSLVLQLSGHRDESLAVQLEALALSRNFHRPARTPQPSLRLLALMSPGDLMANTPLELLLEDADVALETLYLMPDEPVPAMLPPCDAVFVAIGESADNQPLLQRLARATHDGRLCGRPVINSAARIARLSRDMVSGLLHIVPGVSMPATRRVDRAVLARLAASVEQPARACEGDWPLLVRPLDSHAGVGLRRIDGPTAMREYLREFALTERFYLSSFIDYRSTDGLYRKYRVVLIDGQPHLCHLAISEHWMIHYLNAGMAGSAGRRDEEARAMVEFQTGFAARHADALAGVQRVLGLEYVGLDCAEHPDGSLLIFEADTAMVVHAMDPPELFGYKQPAMQRVFTAFRQMLAERSRSPR